jgi:hypothetical protein
MFFNLAIPPAVNGKQGKGQYRYAEQYVRDKYKKVDVAYQAFSSKRNGFGI